MTIGKKEMTSVIAEKTNMTIKFSQEPFDARTLVCYN